MLQKKNVDVEFSACEAFLE